MTHHWISPSQWNLHGYNCFSSKNNIQVFKNFFLFVYHGKRVIVEVFRGFHLFTFIQYLVIHVHFVVGHFDGH